MSSMPQMFTKANTDGGGGSLGSIHVDSHWRSSTPLPAKSTVSGPHKHSECPIHTATWGLHSHDWLPGAPQAVGVTGIAFSLSLWLAGYRLFRGFCSPRSLPLNMTKDSPWALSPGRLSNSGEHYSSWKAGPQWEEIPVLDFWDKALATSCLRQHPSL